jgi:hypothetical protein
MENWVVATLFDSGSPGREVYINLSIVTNMRAHNDRTEVNFSDGTSVNVDETPDQLVGTRCRHARFR